MAPLIYVTNVSLDGYIEDPHGAFDWAPPDPEVFAATTSLIERVGTFLYGRRLYETMAVWETDATLAGHSDLNGAFASAWAAADKVVYSTTLTHPSTTSTRIERHFDPAAVRALKAATTSDVTIGGAELAARAFESELVDECHLFVWPMTLGGGKPALPAGLHLGLELLEEDRLGNGVVQLRYRVSA
jgi:dihydrofolate reductase